MLEHIAINDEKHKQLTRLYSRASAKNGVGWRKGGARPQVELGLGRYLIGWDFT